MALCEHWDVLAELRYEQYSGTNGQTDKFPDYQLSGEGRRWSATSAENEFHERKEQDNIAMVLQHYIRIAQQA